MRSSPSNIAVNGFDYSYYALKLCAFFITVYIVVLAAGTIAGEQSAGTLKLLAIRPYTRNKLLSAKILATFAIGAILLFVSSIASLVIGGVTYGFNFTNVLAVFNSTMAFSISPALLYFVALLSIFVEVMFYALLSVFISTVFKSNIGAVSISTLIFFISLVLNTLAVNAPLLGLLPFVNVNFFKYFGSAFLPNSGNKLISQILTPTVFAGSTFWSSFIIYMVTIIVITIVTHLIFKKRDIK
ncbi:MAG: ABC transporter permease [Clostridia bacterium]|nr:ABC transporter permease [Clostridia bacterium]